MEDIKEQFDVPVGYSDNGESTLVDEVAVSLGADIIEKHITLKRKAKGTDYYSSLDPEEFKKFVDFLKKSYKAFSTSKWDLTKAEIEYRKFNKDYKLILIGNIIFKL